MGGETNLHNTNTSVDYRIYILFASYLELHDTNMFYKHHGFGMNVPCALTHSNRASRTGY